MKPVRYSVQEPRVEVAAPRTSPCGMIGPPPPPPEIGPLLGGGLPPQSTSQPPPPPPPPGLFGIVTVNEAVAESLSGLLEVSPCFTLAVLVMTVPFSWLSLTVALT